MEAREGSGRVYKVIKTYQKKEAYRLARYQGECYLRHWGIFLDSHLENRIFLLWRGGLLGQY